MRTFREFLEYYNNLDVAHFVTAIERFQTFYFDKGIDVFKTAISIPGIARQLLFTSAKQQQATFALFDQRNADLYQTVKDQIKLFYQIVSIVFCFRQNIVNKTAHSLPFSVNAKMADRKRRRTELTLEDKIRLIKESEARPKPTQKVLSEKFDKNGKNQHLFPFGSIY